MLRRIMENDTEEDYRQAFNVFDANGDQLISIEELTAVINILGDKLTSEEIEEMIDEFDIDGDKHINYEEFIRMM